MSNFRVQDLALQNNFRFNSRSEVTGLSLSSTRLAGAQQILVYEAPDLVTYIRQDGATDLIAGDLSTWTRVSVVRSDLASMTSDFADTFTTTPRAFGVWTPALNWTNGSGAVTYTVSEGSFYIDGNGVDIRANLAFSLGTVTPTDSNPNYLALTGLPYPARTGTFSEWLNIRLKNINLQTPFNGSGLKVRFEGGSSVGVFAYDVGHNLDKIYLTGLTDVPIGNGTIVTLGASGKTAQIFDFEPDTGTSSAGYVTLFRRFGAITDGMTLTGAARSGHPGWSGVASSPTKNWYGADAEGNLGFLRDGSIPTGQTISMEISGRMLI